MLLLDSARTIDFDGITVFPDDADKNQFWCLPGPVALRKGAEGRPKFSLIAYKRADADALDGGFAMFEVALRLEEQQRRLLLNELRQLAPDPRLSTVQFIDGNVECIALNVQGAGGTEAEEPPPGGFAAVRKILGARHPELFGDVGAAFSLELDPEGATILKAAFDGGLSPLGVVYDLEFIGLRPALEVTLKADLNRVYQYFGGTLTAKYLFLEGSISAGLEKLHQDRVIELDVKNFSTESDRREQETAALALFKDQLMADWFKPSLTAGAALAAGAQSTPDTPSSPATPEDGGGTTSPPTTPDVEEGPTGGGGSETETESSVSEDDNEGGGTGGGTSGEPSPGTQSLRQLAVLSITTPEAERAGITIEHSPSAQGNDETLRMTGVSDTTVKVDDTPVDVSNTGTIDINVPAGTKRRIVIERAARTERGETFRLFFDKDEPDDTAWSIGSEPFRRYVEGQPAEPSDDRFLASRAPGQSGSERGREALRSWISSRLVAVSGTKRVHINAHASFEREPSPSEDQRERNDQELSKRRLDVATGIVSDLATVASSNFHGHTAAESDNRTDDPIDRTAEITGVIAPAVSSVTVIAEIGRAPDQVPEVPGEIPPEPPAPEDQPPDAPETPPDSGGEEERPDPTAIANKLEVAFELKFLRQEERKLVTYSYRRSEAVKRKHRPQGFFELLLDDMDMNRHFMQIDNDDPFFRELSLTVQPPVSGAEIELVSTNIGIDYGNPADAANHRFADHVFNQGDTTNWEINFNFNASNDVDFAYNVTYRFANGGKWEGSRSVYEFSESDVTQRTLPLSPYEHLDFHELEFRALQVDWDTVAMLEVTASVRDGEDSLNQHFELTELTENHDWKIRLANRDELSVDVTTVSVLKNGNRLPARTLRSSRSRIFLDDGMPDTLNIAFLVSPEARQFDSIFIELTYIDEENQINRRIEKELTLGDSRADIRMAIIDPDRRRYDVSFTFISLASGRRETRTFTGIDDEVLFISPS